MTDAHHVGRVREVFDAWADAGRAEGMEAGHGFAARVAFDRLALQPGEHYVDVGCGNGYTVRWAAEAVGPSGSATGLDLSSRMVARARAASGAFANVTFHEVTFPDHPLPKARHDAVFSIETLYYLPSVEAGLAAIHDMLRPGGRFACVVDFYFENGASHSWPEDLGCPMNLLSMAAWRAAFAATGFEVTEQACLQHPLAPDETPTWKHDQGSLLMVAVRP